MRYLIALAFVFAAAFVSAPAHARTCGDMAINATDGTTFVDEDVSGGSASTAAIDTLDASTIAVGVDLTDASDGVTKIRLTFTAANGSSDTYRKAPWCSEAGTVWTCGELKIDWNPQTHGKSFVIYVPWPFESMKITATLTGAGASDTLSLTDARACLP